MRTTKRGEIFGASRGMPIAAARSVTESGSSRTPGLERGEAERDREVQRDDEEDPR